MSKFSPGFKGRDSMRERAERMLKDLISHVQGQERIGKFKKGGYVKVHGLTKEQTNLHLPKRLKNSGNGNKTQKVCHKSMGGQLVNQLPTGIAPSAMKKGGNMSKKHRYASGGNVYEREMAGEHPTRKMHHYNYEANMRGEHPTKGVSRGTNYNGMNKKRGGHVNKLAMGGVGKIRHKEATSYGKPIRRKLDLSK